MLNIIQIPINILSPLIGILAIYLGFGVKGFVATRIFLMAIGSLVVIALAFRHLHGYRVRPKIHLETLKLISGYLGTGIMMRLTGFVSGGLDRTLIGSWVSVSAVTAYTLQWSVISPVQSVLGNTFNYLFPLSSSLQATGEHERFSNIFTKSAILYSVIVCSSFGMIFLFGLNFITLWVGKSVADQLTVVFPLLVISAFVTQLTSNYMNATVIGTGRLRLYAKFMVIKSISLGVLLLILVRYCSLTGAGIAYLVTCLADVIYTKIGLKSIITKSFMCYAWKVYIKPISLTVICSVIFWPMRYLASSWLSLGLLCSFFIIILEILFIIFRVVALRDAAILIDGLKSMYFRFKIMFLQILRR